ncbi:MAG: matrixin family metalloprotease [Pseudomonadota bacterium]
MTSYLLTGDKFNQNDITYYIDPTLTYSAGIIAAIQRWDDVLSLDFSATSTRAGADIYITEGYIDGLDGGTLGVARWFTNGAGSVTRGTVTFDQDEGFASNYTLTYKVALHEIGHILGLDHPSSSNVIMSAFIPRSLNDLAAGDIAGGQYLYGSEDGSVLPGGGASSSGWTYEYSLQWQYGWNVGWTYGWTVGWNVGWYLEYTPDQFTYTWQLTGQNWGWTLGWGWIAYVDGFEQVAYYFGYGYYSDLIDQYEYVGSWTYTTAWVYGWHQGWYQGWHVGWNLNWYQTWGWGWVLNSGAAQAAGEEVLSGHSHGAGCACSHCLGGEQNASNQEGVFEVTVYEDAEAA